MFLSSSSIIQAVASLVSFEKEQYEWVSLSANELNGWYSPQDLCMLQSDERVKFPSDIRRRNCSNVRAARRGIINTQNFRVNYVL